MSLSQDNLQAHHHWGGGMGAGGMSSMPNGTNMGYNCNGNLSMGDASYLQQQGRDGPRRASDPVRPLDRRSNIIDPHHQRLQRHHSYSNFNPRTPLMPPSARHPNQGLKLDQVGEDEPIENKLILPDDMVNYLNQVSVHEHICKLNDILKLSKFKNI